MKTRLLTAALLSASVIATAAFAQSTQPAPTTPAPAATASSTTTNSNQNMALKGKWRASKLIGLDVYNEQNEKLGDINELIMDKDGKVNAVVIGVGGFLGMGEHDIAVTMDKLKFVEEPLRTSSAAPATTTTTTAPRDNTTTGAATTTAPATTTKSTTTTTTTASNANDWVPDHAIMSGTKDQLKAMPQFKYSDYN